MPLLEAKSISKIFGKLMALDGAALTVGEQEFHGKFPFNVTKGDTQTIQIYDYSNPPQAGPVLDATALYNAAEATKWCRVHRDNGGTIANQVEP